jgi:hypothetical protein
VFLTIVTFPAAPVEDARALLEAAAPAYRAVPGLRRKYFIGNAEEAGGVYEWEDRAAAERFFDDDWRARMQQRYDAVPELRMFDLPCLVDNVAEEVRWGA